MKLVILITTQNEKGLDVALAWQEAGVPGVTILRTHGLYTLQQEARHGGIELPLMLTSMASALAHIIDNIEERGQMLLSIVEPEMVDKLIEVTHRTLGNLNRPDTGVLFVLDVERAIGVTRHGS